MNDVWYHRLLQHPPTRASLIFTSLVVSLFVLGWLLRPVLTPLLISLILYAVLLPFIHRLVRNGLSRTWAGMWLILFLVLAITLVTTLLIPELVDTLVTVTPRMQQLGNLLNDQLQLLNQRIQQLGLPINLDQWLNGTSQLFKFNLDSIVQGSNLVLSVLANLMLIPLITFFLIRDFPAFRNRTMGLLPNRSFELGWLIYFRVSQQLQKYIRGLLIQQGIMALVSAIGFWLTGFDSPMSLGLLVGLFGVIPYLGPALGIIPPMLQAFTGTEPSLYLAGAAVGVIVLAYLIDNLLVVPLWIAQVVSLHPLIVLLGVILCGHLFGLAGMVLAIPTLVVVKLVYGGLLTGLSSSER